MKRKDVVEVLKEAKRLLVKVGWTKGQSRKLDKNDKVVGYCATGAITSANPTYYAQFMAQRILKDVIPHIAGHSYLYPNAMIALWNDRKSTTKKQVIDAFNLAIKAATKKKKIK